MSEKIEKEIVKEETLGEQTEGREMQSSVLVTHTDSYIHERMKAQPRNLKSFDLRVEEKKVPGTHRLSLPPEFKAYERKYTFRWIFKRKQAIDEACDVKGWTLVNRTYFPDVPAYHFNVSGACERGDNILAFIPKKKAEELRKIPGQKSNDMINAALNRHKGNPNFYVPKGDDDDGTVIGI